MEGTKTEICLEPLMRTWSEELKDERFTSHDVSSLPQKEPNPLSRLNLQWDTREANTLSISAPSEP